MELGRERVGQRERLKLAKAIDCAKPDGFSIRNWIKSLSQQRLQGAKRGIHPAPLLVRRLDRLLNILPMQDFRDQQLPLCGTQESYESGPALLAQKVRVAYEYIGVDNNYHGLFGLRSSTAISFLPKAAWPRQTNILSFQ